MSQVRQKKADDKVKIAGGTRVMRPEVFASNYMKQQRNFVHYKRHKRAGDDVEDAKLQNEMLAKE